MKISFIALADAATIGDGKLNLLGVFDEFATTQIPFDTASWSLAARLQAEREDSGIEQSISFLICDKRGQTIMKTPNIAQFLLEQTQDATPEQLAKAKLPQIPFVFNFHSVPFPRYDDYLVRILVNGQMIGETPVKVISPAEEGESQ